MLGIFSLNLAADESREVAITGEYFEIRNAPWPIALIELLDRTGAVISRLDNPEQSDFVRPGLFEIVRITNGPIAQKIKHFYGSGDAGSRRTSGDVSVIDGGKNRTIAGITFGANAFQPPVATNFSIVQLWNPPGSGKNVIVETLEYSSTAAGFLICSINAVQATNLIGSATSKKAGAAVSTTQVRRETAVTIGGVGSLLFSNPVSANQVISKALREPLVLSPGFGAVVFCGTANIDLFANFEFYEDPI